MDFLKYILSFVYNNKKYLIVFVFLFSVFCSLFFLIFLKNLGPVQHQELNSDFAMQYQPIAENILTGKGITLDGEFTFSISPGFPIILSGIFLLADFFKISRITLILFFNILFTGLSAVILFFIAKEVFNKKTALISAILWASYPFNLWFIKGPHSEVPFVPILLLSIYLYILGLKKGENKLAFFSGLAVSLASTVRLITLFLPLFFIFPVFIFSRKKSGKTKIIFISFLLLGAFIGLLPWGFYSYLKTGGFVPISEQGPIGIVFGINFLSLTGEGGDKADLPDDVNRLIERVGASDLDSFSKLFKFFSKEFIIRPVAVLKLIFIKAMRSWYATSQQWWETRILIIQLLYLISGIWGMYYVVRNYKEKIPYLIAFLSIIAYFWLMAFLNVSILRYMVSVMGLIMIFSSFFIFRVKTIFKYLLFKT